MMWLIVVIWIINKFFIVGGTSKKYKIGEKY